MPDSPQRRARNSVFRELPESLDALTPQQAEARHEHAVNVLLKRIQRKVGKQSAWLAADPAPQVSVPLLDGFRMTSLVSQIELAPGIHPELMKKAVDEAEAADRNNAAGFSRRLLITFARAGHPLVTSRWFQDRFQDEQRMNAVASETLRMDDGSSHMNGIHHIGVYHTGPQDHPTHQRVAYVKPLGVSVTVRQDGRPSVQVKKTASGENKPVPERLFVQILTKWVEEDTGPHDALSE